MRTGRLALTVVLLGGAGAVYGDLYGLPAVMGGKGAPANAATAAPAPQAMPVPVTPVVKRTIPITLDYSARTESIRNITLQSKVPGYVQDQHAADGADVKTGDLLYKIDSRDFQATLDGMNAQAERDAAALDYSRSNYHRGDELSKSGWLARDSFDQRASSVQQAQAALNMDKAAIHTAQLNLDYTEIHAPFAGRLGRNQAPVGTLISVASTVLNTLVQLDPIYVTFNPSETDLVQIQKARAGGKVTADIFVAGDTRSQHQGELTFIDNTVDRATGTVTARATIANPDFTLLPGQYVRVRLHVRDEPDALLVPQTALGSSQLGKFVFVVGDGSKVDQRFVSLGPTEGDLVSVLKGVGESDQIISGNLQKIGPGMPVQALPAKSGS